MIVKILPAKPTFSGVCYNTNKIDRNKGELMKVANFGPLQGLGKLRPQDYVNYLKMVSALNKNISKPQFHAVISAKGKSYDKHALTKIAVAWLKEMGYSSQPYLIVYHKDTDNNHVHMVSTRVDRDGIKIPSDFEHRRAVKNINKVLGYDFGFQYKFSTRAQFLMILENNGYLGTDPDEKKIQERINKFQPDKARAAEIKNILQQYKNEVGFEILLKSRYDIDLVFHAAVGKRPYGYSIIDHETKQVFKGSEVLPLKELLNSFEANPAKHNAEPEQTDDATVPAYIQSIRISDDVDDQQVHGRKRRRQRKARTNTR
jgi:Relaxase/Mobilisation nuclease domain